MSTDVESLARSLAGRLRSKFDLSGPPYDPVELANAMSVQISTIALHSAEGVTSWGPKGFNIGLTFRDNTSETMRRRERYTLAHELGHVAFELTRQHRIANADLSLNRLSFESIEKFCDVFAAELLMPTNDFLEQASPLDPGVDSLRTLADIFDANLVPCSLRVKDTECWPYLLFTTTSASSKGRHLDWQDINSMKTNLSRDKARIAAQRILDDKRSKISLDPTRTVRFADRDSYVLVPDHEAGVNRRYEVVYGSSFNNYFVFATCRTESRSGLRT